MSKISGLNTADFSKTIRPQDDLYRYVNANWLDSTEIPADRARFGSFHKLADAAEMAVKQIIEDAQSAEPGTAERQFGDLYTSFMNEERIEALGWKPLDPLFEQVATVHDVESLLTLLGEFERKGLAAAIHLFVDNDPGNPERYIVFFHQGGLGLPDEAYYREDSFAEIREKYRAHVARMLKLAGLNEPEAQAEAIFELETKIAKHHWDKVKNREATLTYNLRNWAEVSRETDGLFEPWIQAIGAPEGTFDEIVVRQPSFIEGLAELFRSESLGAWRAWLRWQLIRSHAAYLHNEAAETNFDFYGRTLTGQPEMRVRWKRGVSLVEGSLGDSVGRIYAEQYFPAESKDAMDELIANLQEAYRQSITNLEWMSEGTREKALDKLSKFTPKIGHPLKWKDYSSIQISADNLIENLAAVNEWEFNREIGKIGKPIDRDEWFMLPQTVNAYYNPGFNEIVFPAAILQPPFFDASWDAAANYGGIGAVIGHEIGHGFDDQGSHYDGDGKLENWWTDEDREAFEARTQSLIAQYDALAPAQTPEDFVNGALTIGENIGDLGGLGIAWKAYLLSLDGQEPPVIDGLTGAQRFFLSWAQVWQQKARDEEVRRLLAIDPHSPNEFRCNQIVRNLDAFYEAFAVTESDALWLDKAERVEIW